MVCLNLHEEHVPDDPVARLDVSLPSDQLISPILGITDQRRDKRIDFVGGMRGLGELEKRVDSGEMAVAFSFFPTTMDDLMAVADANEVMPPSHLVRAEPGGRAGVAYRLKSKI